MSRQSAFSGTFHPNQRPYLTVTADVYVALQGETTVIGCGECRRKLDLNRYVTSVSTEASVDGGSPGSATVTLTVPDTDVNNFFVDGQLLIIPMMEIELFSKGYFLVGGFPQYYRIFWGIVSSVSKSWSNGTTTITVSCKDILRWWELTNVTTNPGFIESFGSSTGNFTFWGNQFAGMNPYTVMIALAREAMGDFSLTTGSFTSFLPEKGAEEAVVGSFAMDIMAYWQLKFGNIWNSLVLYGTSGQAYSFSGESGTFSPVQISEKIFAEEERLNFVNQETGLFKINPGEIATFKQSIDRAVDFELFQSEQQSKYALANSCKDQAGYEFFCDPCGDIVFKPPFYNLNVMPNKPVSWIQDFEVLDDSVTDSEAEVYTHITASGNAFGGVMDYCLSDEITTPRTGAFDFHLLRRYGWRKYDYQCEWAGNPKKLFFHLLDYLDRLNAKRQNGTVTIPLRPELKLGFPIWFPKYDSFFYVTGISHNYSAGGQATTSLTLSAKRSKFIAPNNIGELVQTGVVTKKAVAQGKSGTATRDFNEATWTISFPDQAGASTSLAQSDVNGSPVILRDPKTGKMLGYPNAVMVLRSSYRGDRLAEIITSMGQQKPAKSGPKGKDADAARPSGYKHSDVIAKVFRMTQSEQKAQLIQRLRAHRYEAGVTNLGAYDYALDRSRTIKEMVLVPVDSVSWPKPTYDDKPGAERYAGKEGASTVPGQTDKEKQAAVKAGMDKQVKEQEPAVKAAKAEFESALKDHKAAEAKLKAMKSPPKKAPAPAPKAPKGGTAKPAPAPAPVPEDPAIVAQTEAVALAKKRLELATARLQDEDDKLKAIKSNTSSLRLFASLNMMVRPVSDEFGFELIGHYRYGRGAFIDRGQTQIKVSEGDASRIVNQVNIQFAPSGGFLTDSSTATNVDPGAVASASMFERMQPDDYVTGASFTGYATRGGVIRDVMLTSQSTYTNLVNANVGRGVYVEADSLRRARTLGELAPTLSSELDASTAACGCNLSTPRWLSYMPRTFIDRVLRTGGREISQSESSPMPVDAKTKKDLADISARSDKLVADRKKKYDADRAALAKKYSSAAKKTTSYDAAKAAALGSDPYLDYTEQASALLSAYEKDVDTIEASRDAQTAAAPKSGAALPDTGKESADVFRGGDYSSFFDILSEFLKEEMSNTYSANNVLREEAYTLGSREIYMQTDADAAEQSNVLGEPSNPLFARAAMGDPDALKAIQGEANLNFGRTLDAAGNFGKTWETGKATIVDDLAGSVGAGAALSEVRKAAKKQQPQSTLVSIPLIGVSAVGDQVTGPSAAPAPSQKQIDAIAALPGGSAPEVFNPRRR